LIKISFPVGDLFQLWLFQATVFFQTTYGNNPFEDFREVKTSLLVNSPQKVI
jgi:uncharacterized membrane protein